MNIVRAADATIARAEYILARYVISTDKDVGRLYQSEWRRAGLQLELLARQVRDSPPQKALVAQLRLAYRERGRELDDIALSTRHDQVGRESVRERVCQLVTISVVAVSFNKKEENKKKHID